jgi:hypothetical protein
VPRRVPKTPKAVRRVTREAVGRLLDLVEAQLNDPELLASLSSAGRATTLLVRKLRDPDPDAPAPMDDARQVFRQWLGALETATRVARRSIGHPSAGPPRQPPLTRIAISTAAPEPNRRPAGSRPPRGARAPSARRRAPGRRPPPSARPPRPRRRSRPAGR